MSNRVKQILCFGDSNTWGYNGVTGKRLPWGVRWTSLLQQKMGIENFHIIEEGLCGRTTVFEDPLRKGRRGTELLPVLLETHAPLDAIIIMLGTNDCKTIFGASAEVIGKGILCLLDQIREYAPKAKVLLISPIYLGEKVWQEGYDTEYSKASIEVSKNLEIVYKKIASERNIGFMKASSYVSCCEEDQQHLDETGHAKFAEAVYEKLKFGCFFKKS